MVNTIKKSTQEKMNKSVEALQHELNTVRTGQANAAILDRIEVDYYGCMTPLNQIASISISEGRTLVIKAFDKSSLKDIEKAIAASDLGLPPQNDGTVIRLNIPALTEERRRELTKTVSKIGEEGKVRIRNVRRDVNDSIKKNKELTEDMQKNAQEEVQKITDEFIKKIDKMVEQKNKEIMSV